MPSIGYTLMTEQAGLRELITQAVAAERASGDDVRAVVKAAGEFFDAGFTDLALVQIGVDHQNSFFTAATSEILPALREL
jgi:hypothetical protein